MRLAWALLSRKAQTCESVVSRRCFRQMICSRMDSWTQRAYSDDGQILWCGLLPLWLCGLAVTGAESICHAFCSLGSNYFQASSLHPGCLPVVHLGFYGMCSSPKAVEWVQSSHSLPVDNFCFLRFIFLYVYECLPAYVYGPCTCLVTMET